MYSIRTMGPKIIIIIFVSCFYCCCCYCCLHFVFLTITPFSHTFHLASYRVPKWMEIFCKLRKRWEKKKCLVNFFLRGIRNKLIRKNRILCRHRHKIEQSNQLSMIVISLLSPLLQWTNSFILLPLSFHAIDSPFLSVITEAWPCDSPRETVWLRQGTSVTIVWLLKFAVSG